MKRYNPNIHNRRSIRLKGYDYSQPGLYYVTICAQNRACLFGNIINARMHLNDAGKMVQSEWEKITERFTNTRLHEYVVMPNHFHAILEIVATDIVGASLVGAPTVSGNAGDDASLVGAPTVSGNAGDDASLVGAPAVSGNVGDDAHSANESVEPDDMDGGTGIGRPSMGQPPSGQPRGFAPTVSGNAGDDAHSANESVGPDGVNGGTGDAPMGSGKTLGDMVGAFQSITTVEYIRGVKTNNWKPFDGKLWQRNYWEYIIRNHRSYQHISAYITNNPSEWDGDTFYEE